MNIEDVFSANEPPAPNYRKPASRTDIQIFNSIQEQEDDNYKWLASLSPVENMQYSLQNIKRIFADELRGNPSLGTDLTFD